MFWVVHKAIIRHKLKNVKDISTLYTKALLIKKDRELSYMVTYILVGLFFINWPNRLKRYNNQLYIKIIR
jgi:hypothetical protein